MRDHDNSLADLFQWNSQFSLNVQEVADLEPVSVQ